MGYFFAIRQIMFILVPMILLTASGVESLLEQRRFPLCAFVVSLLVLSSLVKNVRYFSDRSENWGAAAATLKVATVTGACVEFVGADDLRYYTFFDRSLSGHVCSIPWSSNQSIAVPFTRYTALNDLENFRLKLMKFGYKEKSSIHAGGATVTLYETSVQSLKGQALR